MAKFPITHSGLPALYFGAQWNNRKGAFGKLYLQCFTSIRRYYPGHDKYQVGNAVEVIVKGTKVDNLPPGVGHVAYGIADIEYVRPLKCKDLQPILCATDAGCTVPQFRDILAGMYCSDQSVPGKWPLTDLDNLDLVVVLCRYSESWHDNPKYYLADGKPVK